MVIEQLSSGPYLWCKQCGMGAKVRRLDAKYCSGRCRTRAWRMLRAKQAWVDKHGPWLSAEVEL